MKLSQLVLPLLLALSLDARAATPAKPNVLIILADDMGFSDLGCYGGEIATPNLDKLAANGLRFTQFYNSAKCEPTRASLMSGQYWQVCGLGIKEGMTMGQAMRTAGYATFAVGKWHNKGNPFDRGFDHYFGHLGGASDYFKGSNSHRLDAARFTPPEDGKFYTTDANADYAMKFLADSRKEHPEKPFFMYLAFNAPHGPLQAWPEDIAKYRGKYMIGWDKLREQRYQRQIELGLVKKEWALSPRPATIPAWDSLTKEEKDFEDARMSVYAAQVDRMDQAIGKVLAKIKELGQEENTLVMFLSDNGANPFDHRDAESHTVANVLSGKSRLEYGLGWANASVTPFEHYKRNMFNGGACTAFIANWPAVVKQHGAITEQRGHIVDLMATLMDVGGGTWPAQFEGQPLNPLPGLSLRPILEGKQRTPHDALYFQLFDHRAVIMGDLKLVSDWGHPWALFDLSKDRTELHDLSKEQPEKVASMSKAWTDWGAKAGADAKFRAAGGEPIYRHMKDAEEKFIGGGGDSGDDEEEATPKKKGKKSKDESLGLGRERSH